MAVHPFVDYVKIYFKSGKGGSGKVSWRREKFVPKGGPDGGDGGTGGSISIRANSQFWTLLDLKYRKFITADDGDNGQGSNKKGKDGDSIVLDVPLGTLAIDADTEEIIGELVEDGQELILVRGGYGGKGNTFFKSSTNQTPDYAQPGQEGIERTVILELKMLADVGLVGFPNAGKSTLLSVLSEARPKIADYPFTTLVPNLGIVRYRDFKSFVMADIPGIIEGASEGKGLGTQFLRHIERNAVLLLMIAADSPDIEKEYAILLNEIETFNEELIDKPRLLAVTKCDMIDEELENEILSSLRDIDAEVVFISSAAQKGLDVLKDKLWAIIRK
ncbi:MAG: GTPase ObgE [Bacteroidia bacterium]